MSESKLNARDTSSGGRSGSWSDYHCRDCGSCGRAHGGCWIGGTYRCCSGLTSYQQRIRRCRISVERERLAPRKKRIWLALIDARYRLYEDRNETSRLNSESLVIHGLEESGNSSRMRSDRNESVGVLCKDLLRRINVGHTKKTFA